VRQVEVAWRGLASLAPRHAEIAIGGEAVHSGVAVAVRDVEISRGGGDHLRRIVEGPSRVGDEVAGLVAAGVRVDAAVAQDLERFAVQSVGETHGIFPVGQIHDIVGDVDAMRIGEGADAPAAQVGPVAVEDHHRRVLALEHIDPILGVGRDRAHVAERLSWWKRRPVLDELVRVFSLSNRRHVSLLSPLLAPGRVGIVTGYPLHDERVFDKMDDRAEFPEGL